MKKRKTRLLSCGFFAAQRGDVGASDRYEPFVQQAPNLVGYLQVDTINPPGNDPGGRLLGQFAGSSWYPHESVESAPGRGNLWARLRDAPDADGNTQPALVLLHHIDMVPPAPLTGQWIRSAVNRSMAIYGRGAIDTGVLASSAAGFFGLGC